MIFEVQTHWRQNNFKLRLCTKPESQSLNYNAILQVVTVFWKETKKQRLQKEVKSSLAAFPSYNKSMNDFWDRWEMQVNPIWTKPRKSAKMNWTFAWVKAARLFLGIDFATHLLRIQWFQLQVAKRISQPLSGFSVPQLPIQNKQGIKIWQQEERRICSLLLFTIWPLPSSELT